jgi:hypothetical protein
MSSPELRLFLVVGCTLQVVGGVEELQELLLQCGVSRWLPYAEMSAAEMLLCVTTSEEAPCERALQVLMLMSRCERRLASSRLLLPDPATTDVVCCTATKSQQNRGRESARAQSRHCRATAIIVRGDSCSDLRPGGSHAPAKHWLL